MRWPCPRDQLSLKHWCRCNLARGVEERTTGMASMRHLQIVIGSQLLLLESLLQEIMYWLVLDFEATCDQGPDGSKVKMPAVELIEFPVALV